MKTGGVSWRGERGKAGAVSDGGLTTRLGEGAERRKADSLFEVEAHDLLLARPPQPPSLNHASQRRSFNVLLGDSSIQLLASGSGAAWVSASLWQLSVEGRRRRLSASRNPVDTKRRRIDIINIISSNSIIKPGTSVGASHNARLNSLVILNLILLLLLSTHHIA